MMSESELERSRRVNARPNNSVLVPCDKLAEMQAELKALKEWQATWRPFLKQHFGVDA